MRIDTAYVIDAPAVVGRSVLVVEDDDCIGQALCFVLERNHYRTTLCSDAELGPI